MAKGGKGRKGGGGGGGKTRKYSRDNNGRFASTGTGATARGGRLLTAKGNKRKTQAITAKGQKGVLAKPKGLKPGAIKPKAAAAAKLGGRLNPAKKAFRAADKKFLSTIQKEKGISKAASNARRDAKSSSDFTKTPTAKGAKINNTISQTKEKRNITTKQRLLKERLTRAYNLPGNGTDAKGRRTAKIKAKAIATLQGTKRPDISDSAVGGLRRTRTSTGYKAPSSRLPTPSRSARAQGRARALMQTQRRNAKGNRIGNPTKIDRKRLIGARAVNFNKNPKAFLRETLVQEVKSKGAKGTAGFVAKPRSLTQTPKRIKPAAKSAAAKPAAPKPASTAAERIKIKTPIRRAMSTNRASVVTPGQRSRLETGKGAKTKGARLNSSVAKPRTAGNTKPQVASRVKRKLAAENAKMNKIVGAERVGARQGKQYERSLKRQTTLQRAKTFLESGKLPGKDNSIAAQRNTKQARQRLAAKNAERRTAATKPAAAKRKSVGSISEAKAGRIISRIDANRPGLRRASGSARKTANAIRTQQRATDFALAASARGRKQGKNLSVNQSLQRAIKNASAKRKPRGMR